MNENSQTDSLSPAQCKALLAKNGYSLLEQSENTWLAWGSSGGSVKLSSLEELQEYARAPYKGHVVEQGPPDISDKISKEQGFDKPSEKEPKEAVKLSSLEEPQGNTCTSHEVKQETPAVSVKNSNNQDLVKTSEREFSAIRVKRCPFCAEEIIFEAVKCKHCREWLDQRDLPSKHDSGSSPKTVKHYNNPTSTDKDEVRSRQSGVIQSSDISPGQVLQEQHTQKAFSLVKKYGWKVAEDESREFLGQNGCYLERRYGWVVKEPSGQKVVVNHLEGLRDYTTEKCNWKFIRNIPKKASKSGRFICIHCGAKVLEGYYTCMTCQKRLVCDNCTTFLRKHEHFGINYCPSCEEGLNSSSFENASLPFLELETNRSDPYLYEAEKEYQSRLSNDGYGLVRKYGWLVKCSSGLIHRIDSLAELLKFTIKTYNLKDLDPSDVLEMNRPTHKTCCYCDEKLQVDLKFCVKCGADTRGFSSVKKPVHYERPNSVTLISWLLLLRIPIVISATLMNRELGRGFINLLQSGIGSVIMIDVMITLGLDLVIGVGMLRGKNWARLLFLWSFPIFAILGGISTGRIDGVIFKLLLWLIFVSFLTRSKDIGFFMQTDKLDELREQKIATTLALADSSESKPRAQESTLGKEHYLLVESDLDPKIVFRSLGELQKFTAEKYGWIDHKGDGLQSIDVKANTCVRCGFNMPTDVYVCKRCGDYIVCPHCPKCRSKVEGVEILLPTYCPTCHRGDKSSTQNGRRLLNEETTYIELLEKKGYNVTKKGVSI